MSTRRRRRQDPLRKLIPVLLCIVVVLGIVALLLPKSPQPEADQPTGSTNSTNSTHSTAPSTPTGSTGQPTDPTDPTDPTNPTDPTDPTDPTNPTDPTDPTNPTNTPNPTNPTDPTNPTVPMDPEALEAFFSESVFIGDSVTLKLRNYIVTHPDALYGAKILCAGSYSVRHAITEPDASNKDIVSIQYQGAVIRPEDALKAIGAKRVFIMLGMNDIAFGIDYTLGNWETLIRNIRAENPEIEIYIQSATPIHRTKDSPNRKLNNANMDIYNQRLEEFCQENGCFFVPLAEHFKDENGQLKDAYCSDPYDKEKNPNGQGCHFTTAGVELWIQLLKEYVTNR